MSPARANLDGHALVARYEDLRQDVVAPRVGHHGELGLALFVRKGMAAWMNGLERKQLHRSTIPTTASAARMPEGIEQSLIDIVATMALATALEGRHDI
jgi:hypothetical protein